jgi:hypothetical protein
MLTFPPAEAGGLVVASASATGTVAAAVAVVAGMVTAAAGAMVAGTAVTAGMVLPAAAAGATEDLPSELHAAALSSNVPRSPAVTSR